MNDRLLHRLFGFICASVGAVMTITGLMFWLKPPDLFLAGWGVACLIVLGAATLVAGIGVAAAQAWGRWLMTGLAAIGILTAVAGVVRAALDDNLAAGIIVLTAVMPLVLVIAVMRELGRPPRLEN